MSSTARPCLGKTPVSSAVQTEPASPETNVTTIRTGVRLVGAVATVAAVVGAGLGAAGCPRAAGALAALAGAFAAGALLQATARASRQLSGRMLWITRPSMPPPAGVSLTPTMYLGSDPAGAGEG